jgi:hypothetical protein
MKVLRFLGKTVALALAPEEPKVKNHRAWFRATCAEPHLRDASLAVRLATKALAGRPQSANYMKTLGAAQYRNRDAKAAVATLEKAMRLWGTYDASRASCLPSVFTCGGRSASKPNSRSSRILRLHSEESDIPAHRSTPFAASSSPQRSSSPSLVVKTGKARRAAQDLLSADAVFSAIRIAALSGRRGPCLGVDRAFRFAFRSRGTCEHI